MYLRKNNPSDSASQRIAATYLSQLRFLRNEAEWLKQQKSCWRWHSILATASMEGDVEATNLTVV